MAEFGTKAVLYLDKSKNKDKEAIYSLVFIRKFVKFQKLKLFFLKFSPLS